MSSCLPPQSQVSLAWLAAGLALVISASSCSSSEPVVEDCYGMGCVEPTPPDATCAAHARRSARIAAGRFHACAIRTDGRVVCWGEPLWLDGEAQSGQEPVMRVVPGLDDARMIAIPGTALLAVTGDSVRYLENYPTLTWSPDLLGDARRAEHGCITNIGPICVSTSDGARHCLHAVKDQSFTTELPGADLAHLDVDRACGWSAFGELQCHDFEVGQATGLDPDVRHTARGIIYQVKGIYETPGIYTMFCAATDTQLACGGAARGGDWYPLEPKTYRGEDIVDLGVSESLGCVLDAAGTVHCWDIDPFLVRVGRCKYPEAVTGCEYIAPTDLLGEPTPVALPGPAQALAVGQGYACALLERDQVACWGDNRRGTLNTGDKEPYDGVHLFTLPEPDP